MSRKITFHQKTIVLAMNKNEAAAIAHLLNPQLGYLVEGKTARDLRNKMRTSLEEVGHDPRTFGLGGEVTP